MRTNERIDLGSKYMQQSQECPLFVIRESVGMEYSCVAGTASEPRGKERHHIA